MSVSSYCTFSIRGIIFDAILARGTRCVRLVHRPWGGTFSEAGLVFVRG